MKRNIILICSVVCALTIAVICQAGKTHVSGYTRKDGTYVSGYDRNSPGSGSSKSSTGGSYYSPNLSSPTPSYSSPKLSSPSHTSSYSSGSSHHRYSAPTVVGARDSNGRIVRSASAKREFMKQTGYPHGRPGYVVDHITALKHGGTDTPSNMQWQTIAEAKAKDKWE